MKSIASINATTNVGCGNRSARAKPMASEAFRQLLGSNIARMLDYGQYVPPEPLDDLSFAITTVQDAYHDARRENVPEDRLQLLRQYIHDAAALREQSENPPLTSTGERLFVVLTKMEKFFENVCLDHDDCKESLLSHVCRHATQRQSEEKK